MRIGIFGTTKAIDKKIANKAKEIGKVIAESGHIVVTGGTSGYPHLVALSTMNAGGEAVSYAAGKSIEDHLQFHDVDLSNYTEVIFQKDYLDEKLLGVDNYLRSLKMCLAIDKAIVISGKVGTMYEVTIMSGMAKDIYILEGSGGVTEKTIKEFMGEGHKTESKMVYFKNLEDLRSLL